MMESNHLLNLDYLCITFILKLEVTLTYDY